MATSEFLSPKQLAELLGISVSSLYSMNNAGTAPRRVRVGKHVRYRMADIDRWLERNTVENDAA